MLRFRNMPTSQPIASRSTRKVSPWPTLRVKLRFVAVRLKDRTGFAPEFPATAQMPEMTSVKMAMKVRVVQPNCDYTTSRPYIEPFEFGSQTLSCEKVTLICASLSTPQKGYPAALLGKGC